MTVGDLRLLLDGVDENKIVVFKDSMNGWCNLKNHIGINQDYVVLHEDSDVPFDD